MELYDPAYDPAIPLLGIYPKEMKAGQKRDMYTPMFIPALFTIAKIWKQPKCPSKNKWIKKMWHLWRTVWRFLKKLKIELPYQQSHY